MITKKGKDDDSAVDTKKPQKEKDQFCTRETKVAFHVDNDDKIVEVFHEYPYEPEMVEDEIWWSDEELDKLLTEAMLIADHFTRERPDWQEKIVSMLKQCRQTDKDKSLNAVKASDLEFVVDSEARGLELYIHPVFQRNREKVIKSVVALQKQVAAREAEKGPDPEFRLNALKNKSMKLTLPARLLAKTLAAGDARVASKQSTENVEDNEP